MPNHNAFSNNIKLFGNAQYLPFNKSGGPSFWPKSNVKFSVQYILYNRFNGGRSDFDGTGRKAKDNNTLYLESWIAF